MKNTIAAAALLLLAASLGACQKATVVEECPQVRRAPAEFLAYWFFPYGSYWVYHKRGSNPVEIDTVSVGYNRVRVFQPGDLTYGLPTCTELYDFALSHSNRRVFPGVSSNNGYRGTEHLETQEENGQWFVRQNSEYAMSPLGFLWSYPQRSVGQPIAFRGPTLLDTLPVTVPAGTFRRSAHLRIPFLFDSTRINYLYDYHLTRGIGYTRLRYANLGTWELVKYHIAR